MYYENAGFDIVVLLSGCIYNKVELYEGPDTPDELPEPELIANTFLKQGPDFVKNLNGDFTIFIIQPQKKYAYLVRDHVGVKPMAFAIEKEKLYFSSDVIALCCALSDNIPINSEFFLSYFRYIDNRETPNLKVKKLPPGHYLHFSHEGAVIVKYWKPDKFKYAKKMDYEKMLADLKLLLWDAVQIRCDPRFNAGAHVSGGIDSGVVSSLARKFSPWQENFYGFSWSPLNYDPTDIKFDERELIKKLCLKARIQPQLSTMNEDDYLRIVYDTIYNQGYFNEDKTLEMARKSKINMIFSGWGGDEFISKDDCGIDTDLLMGLHLRSFFRRNRIKHFKKFAKNFLLSIVFPALGTMDPRITKSYIKETRYLKEQFKKHNKQALRSFYFYRSRRGHQLGYLRHYHLQERCETWAVNGFRHGVEYRYPLLDKRIIAYMLQVPSTLLIKSEYYRTILREISEDLIPDEVRWHWQKVDPVQMESETAFISKSANVFLEELSTWKKNPDLHFIDFDLLEKDINEFKDHPDDKNNDTFFRLVVFIKAIHEFTYRYRELNEL